MGNADICWVFGVRGDLCSHSNHAYYPMDVILLSIRFASMNPSSIAALSLNADLLERIENTERL